MVHPVTAVSSIGRMTQEADRKPYRQQETVKNNSFSSILKEKLQEEKDAPRSCQTFTYGHDSMLHMFQYQSREYHY